MTVVTEVIKRLEARGVTLRLEGYTLRIATAVGGIAGDRRPVSDRDGWRSPTPRPAKDAIALL